MHSTYPSSTPWRRQYKVANGSTWYNMPSSFTGYNAATLQVGATAARNGYSYRCVVTDAGGNSVTSNAVTLTVK